MKELFYLLIPASILLINSPLYKYNMKKFWMSCNNTTLNTLRGDVCYNSIYRKCPLTASYKQCTNNNFPITKCNCLERSFELCPRCQQFNQKKVAQVLSKYPSPVVLSQYDVIGPRVNMYSAKETSFDVLK